MIAPLVLATLIGATEVPDTTRRYAIVLGVNEPGRAGQKSLAYADDDAARFFLFFRAVGTDAALLALLDEETQRLYPEAVKAADLPDAERLFSRLDQIFDRVRADNERGLETELYFVYSGHGFVDDHGEGHLALRGATLSRTDLYERVLARSPAKVNHLIIDACDAYFVVQSRGDGENIEALLNARAEEFLARQTLEHYPNTGAILSTASRAESHEWSEIRAGVFSHGVRSALVGAADADRDGLVSYTETEAFVLAAMAGVQHASANRAVFVRAPRVDRQRPVIDLRYADATRLHLAREIVGRVALADDRGRRYADLNKAAGHAVALTLLPGRQYFVRIGDKEYAVPADEREVELARLPPGPPTIAARGSIADAYHRGLFAVPYGPQLVDGFALGAKHHSTVDLTVAPKAESNTLRIAAWAATGATVAAVGVATGTYLAGSSVHDEWMAESDPETSERLDRRIRRWDTATNVAIGAAVSFGVTAGVLFIIDAID